MSATWREHRVFRRTDDALEVRSTATYTTEIGGEGVARNAWRIVGDDSYLGIAADDGMLWYRRDADARERLALETAGVGSLQALLDAAEGWAADGATWRASSDGSPLRCTNAVEGDGWIDRFVASAQVEHGELVASPLRREATLSWRLTDGSTVTARLEDRIESGEDPIEPPPDDQVVEVLRDRSLARAVKLVEKLAERGVAEVASVEPQPPQADKRHAEEQNTD